MASTKTYHIIYGFAEGPKIGEQLETALQAADLTSVDLPAQADVIFAHSGGCYFVPEHLPAKLYMLIGLPYWPGKPVAVSSVQKVTQDMAEHTKERALTDWFKKTAWNLFYMGGDGVWMAQFLFRRQRLKIPYYTEEATIVVVRNHDDPYFGPEIASAIQDRTNWRLVELPGGHDDCWQNPQPYVDLISEHLTF